MALLSTVTGLVVPLQDCRFYTQSMGADSSTWRRRWREVNGVTDAEARAATPAERLVAIAELHAFARHAPRLESEIPSWERMQLLRSRYRDRSAGR
jgi:hypothetical protein